MGNGAAFVNLHRPGQRGRCGSSGFLPHPAEPEQSLAGVTDRRGECDDPAAASGLLHTLRAGRSCGLRRHRASTSGAGSVGRWSAGPSGTPWGGRTQARGRVSFLQAAPCSESARLKSNHPLGVFEARASNRSVLDKAAGPDTVSLGTLFRLGCRRYL
jgi:hypothetical protein